MFKTPNCWDNSNWDTIKSLSALANAIRASKRRLLDWITSNVDLVFPESYSNVIPSLAISAAFNWALVASKTLFKDLYFDHEFEVSEIVLFFVSCRRSLARSLSKVDFLIEEIFSPPFIIGHVIDAFTVSSSLSSIVELKSSFSVFETFIEADGDSLERSIFNSLIEIS